MQINDGLAAKDRWQILTVFTVTYFFAAFAALSFAPLLPFIQEDLLLSNASLGLFISTIYLGALISGFPAGWISDKYGVPITISVGLVIQGLLTGVVAYTSSFSLIVILLFIAGFGYGAVNPASSKGIIKWFTAKWRATAMAVKQVGFTGGNMAAAAILPVIAEITGWRKTIIIVAVSVMLCGLINFFAYPSKIRNEIKSSDPDTSSEWLKADEPVWKNRQIIFWSFITIFYAAIQLSGTAYMAVYMVKCFSYSKVMAGLFLSITQGGGALGRIIWGRISDLYFAQNREKEIILVGFIAAATCITLGMIPENTHFIIIGFIAVIFGFAAIGYNVLFLTYIGEIAGPERAGQAIGFWVTIAYSGAVVSPPLFGFMVDKIGFRSSWITLGSLMVVVMILTVLYTKKKKSILKS